MLTDKEKQVLIAHRLSWEVNPTAGTRRALSRILFQLRNGSAAREALDDPANGPTEMADILDAMLEGTTI